MYVPALVRAGGMRPAFALPTLALPTFALPTLALPVAAWPATVRVASLLTGYRTFREKRHLRCLPYPASAGGNPRLTGLSRRRTIRMFAGMMPVTFQTAMPVVSRVVMSHSVGSAA
jgi:hypothetical protein